MSTVFPVRTYPRGMDCEIFPTSALEKTMELTSMANPEHLPFREHVTQFIVQVCVVYELQSGIVSVIIFFQEKSMSSDCWVAIFFFFFFFFLFYFSFLIFFIGSISSFYPPTDG
jgi:hypothetical protein